MSSFFFSSSRFYLFSRNPRNQKRKRSGSQLACCRCCSPGVYNVLTRDCWLENRKEREKQGEVVAAMSAVVAGILKVCSVGYKREGGGQNSGLTAAARVIIFILRAVIIFQSGVIVLVLLFSGSHLCQTVGSVCCRCLRSPRRGRQEARREGSRRRGQRGLRHGSGIARCVHGPNRRSPDEAGASFLPSPSPSFFSFFLSLKLMVVPGL